MSQEIDSSSGKNTIGREKEKRLSIIEEMSQQNAFQDLMEKKTLETFQEN